jgi:hypothetical protein
MRSSIRKKSYKTFLSFTILFFFLSYNTTIPAQIRSNTFLGFGLFTDGFKNISLLWDFTSSIKEALQWIGFSVVRYDLDWAVIQHLLYYTPSLIRLPSLPIFSQQANEFSII